jgi:hypothetical protein
MVKKLVLGMFCGIAMLASTSAYAGYQDSGTAQCVSNADGSGSCEGTMLGFRNAPNSAFAYFSDDYDSLGVGLGFYAFINNNPYACSVVPGSALEGMLRRNAMIADGYFYITWDKKQNCSGARFRHGSAYKNF